MKTMITIMTLFMAFSTRGALLTIELDKSDYQINEAIQGSLIISGSTELLGGAWGQLDYNSNALSIQSWSYGIGFDDGLGSYPWSDHLLADGALYLSDYADMAADTSILAANQGSEFVFAQFTATGLVQGMMSLSLSDFGLVDFDNDFITVDSMPVSFSVSATQVPEPMPLALMAVSLVLAVRGRKAKWHLSPAASRYA